MTAAMDKFLKTGKFTRQNQAVVEAQTEAGLDEKKPKKEKKKKPEVSGPYHAHGLDFWIKKPSCMVGFDTNDNGKPDKWVKKTKIDDENIEERQKLGIRAQLEACGC
jgi:hypothetical protein